MKTKKAGPLLLRATSLLLSLLLLLPVTLPALAEGDGGEAKKSYIRWIDFDVSAAALRDASRADIAAHEAGESISWIDLLSALGQKYGGDFSKYRKKDLDSFVEAARTAPLAESVTNKKLYAYYQKAYGAVLSGLLGPYTEEVTDENGVPSYTPRYGIKAFHPLAAGYSYSHSDDFGNSRSYGYKRRHLGHDLFGSVGTPVVATESGYVEALGWNQYGGWRVGIRSFDGRRYYYYAHLRKGHPYADLYEGKIVSAGEIIGYLGMTGYSRKEDVNKIRTPHLHYGLEIIFDPSQKDGVNQIWVSMYELTKFLEDRRARAYRAGDESISRIRIIDENMPD